jgi:uncharacterized protein
VAEILLADPARAGRETRYKVSSYNCLVERPDDRLAYNFFSGALAEFDAQSWGSFKKVLGDANGELDDLETELRAQMVEAGFLIPAGCDEVQSLRLRYNLFRLDPRNIYLTIVPTMACNFACPYCYQQDHLSGKMTAETEKGVTNFVRRLVDQSTQYVTVTWYGGEPLLGLPMIRRLSRSFLNLCQEYGVQYIASVVTNGYLLTGEVAKELSELGVVAAQVTVDGPKGIHDSRRMLKGGGGTFDRIMGNLLQAHKYIAITMRVNVDAQNLDSMEELSVYLRSTGLADNMRVCHERVEATPRYEEPCFRTRQEFGARAVQLHHPIVAESVSANPQMSPHDDYCVADKLYGFVINYDGNVYKCWADLDSLEEMHNMRLGHVDGALDAVLFTRWLSMAPWDDPECLACKMLPVCLGGCPKTYIFHQRKYCVPFRDNEEQYVLLKAAMARREQGALPEPIGFASGKGL